MRVLAAFLLVLAGAVVAGIAYQAGVATGLATTLPAGTAPAVPWLYPPLYGFGFGFGFLGLLFPLFFVFLVFGLIRAAAGGGHWGEPGWHGRRQTMFEEWHRQAHGTSPAQPDDRPRS